MQANKFIKVIAGVLIAGQVALMPGLALAVVSTALGSLNPVPSNDTGSVVGNSIFDAAFTPIKATYTGCNTAIKAFEATDNAIQLGFSFSAVIGGGGALATALQAETVNYNIYLTCLTGILTSLDLLTPPNTYTSTLKQQLYTQAKADTQTYQAKLKTAQGRYAVASENIWKALLVSILMNTTKVVADQLVNRLVNNYKISNIKQYTDSVATLMYDNQFIRDNFPDSQGQMMARAILTNSTLRSQIQQGIFVRANLNLGFDPAELSYSDPNFYTKMSSVGSSYANPYFIQTDYLAGVDQAHASAVATAQSHISQGNGYKAPVNCASSLAQQQQIDQQTKAATDLLANRQALLNNLLQAQKLGQPVSANDIARAQADLDAAQKSWDNLPFTVAGANSVSGSSSLKTNLTSGTNTEGTAAIIMCEAISSPAVLVNQGIDSLFKAMDLGRYNDNNLPGFISSISGIATQIGSSMVLGGITHDSSNINENQAIGAAVNTAGIAAVQTFNNNAQSNLAKGIDFEASPNSTVANGYGLTWSVVTNQLPTASYISITGPGITGATDKLPLSGSYLVVSSSTGNYLLTVYDAAGKALTSANVSTTPSQQAYNPNPNGPAVAGAFTIKSSLDIRGPAVVVEPRGE